LSNTPSNDAACEADPVLLTDQSEALVLPEAAATVCRIVTSSAVISNREDTRVADVAPEVDAVLHPQPLEAAGELTSSREHRYGNGDATIIAAEIRDLQGRTRTRLRSLEAYEIHWKVAIHRPISDICYGILLRDARGIDLFGADSYHLSGLQFGPQQPGTRITAKTRFRANLAGGHYFLTLALANLDQTKYDLRFDAIELMVEPILGIHHSSLVNLEVEFAPEAQVGFSRREDITPKGSLSSSLCDQVQVPS